jgi:predicted transcriptional regulator
MRYRNRIAIYAEVLEVAQDGALKTQIMYRTNQSSQYLQQTLDLLLASGLLKYDKGKRVYSTTTKGMKFLEDFDKLTKMLPVLKSPNPSFMA